MKITLDTLPAALTEVDAWVDAYPADTVLALWEARAWEMLDLQSWEALCDSRGWTRRVALPRPERQEVVGRLRQEGMSTRAIAAATGVDDKTIRNDLRITGADNSAPVVGTDGKTYQPTRKSTEAAERVIEPEVITAEEFVERYDADNEPDLDDLVPSDLRFQRRFWGHLKATHDLLLDLDYPQYFDEDMVDSLARFVDAITCKHTELSKSRRTLRVVQGGTNT